MPIMRESCTKCAKSTKYVPLMKVFSCIFADFEVGAIYDLLTKQNSIHTKFTLEGTQSRRQDCAFVEEAAKKGGNSSRWPQSEAMECVA